MQSESAESGGPIESTPGYAGYDGGAAGRAHNEAAFRHFLNIERRRAGRSGRAVVLVLVSLRERPGTDAVLTTAAAAGIFSALGLSVREVDFVGWYRDGRVAAAALIQRAIPLPATCQRIAERVTETLQQQSIDSSLPARIRVIPLR
jgi:hypothetical protein